MSGSAAARRDLILACACPVSDLRAKVMIESLLDVDLDADRLIAQASQHRVLPLMYAHLQSIGPGHVPPDLMQPLRAHFHGQAVANYRLTQQLVQVLKLLDDHGIPAIPWKGPVLALMAYGDLKLRPYSDLDLIVPETQIEVAKDLLCEQGYRLLGNLTKRQQARHRRAFHAYTLMPKGGKGCIDLHWRITQHFIPFPIEMNMLWTRLETLEIEDVPVRCLSPEDTLLLLCVHGTVHRWAELGWLSDIAALVHRFPTLDWEGVLTHSRHLNSERMVLLGLNLCRDLLGTDLPAGVLNRIAVTPRVESLRANVVERLWSPPVTQWQRLIHYGLAAQTLSRLSDRVRFWWRTTGWAMGPRLKIKVKGWYGRWRYRHLLKGDRLPTDAFDPSD